jgi:hypothetical protein
VVFNSKSRNIALHAIQSELQEANILLSGISLPKLIEALQTRHAPIISSFYSGVGTKLQKIDGEIARDIMTTFAKLNRPCLGIHDSFIVMKSDEDLLRTTMEESYRKIMTLEAAKDGYLGWVPNIDRK